MTVMPNFLVFQPVPESLQRLAAMPRGSAWPVAKALMAQLESQGFCQAMANLDSAQEFSQSMTQAGAEIAMAYISRDDKGLVFCAGLAWTVCQGIEARQWPQAVDALTNQMTLALGSACAVTQQTQAWSSGEVFSEQVVYACFWSQSQQPSSTTVCADVAVEFTGPNPSTRIYEKSSDYQLALQAQPHGLTLCVTVSKDSIDGDRNCIGIGIGNSADQLWSIHALVCI